MKSSTWTYSEVVKDHFMNPRNILDNEEEYPADGRGEVGNIRCGDQMLVVIQVEDDRIVDCKWKTYGCASAIASTSILSEMVIGKTLSEAYKIGPKDIISGLEGLPANKIHCSVLGDKALRAAIEDYYRRTGREEMIPEEQVRTICECLKVTDKDIEKAVKEEGVRSWEELQGVTKIGTDCGNCEEEGKELLHQYVHLYGDV